jgi:hypothetical protein
LAAFAARFQIDPDSGTVFFASIGA